MVAGEQEAAEGEKRQSDIGDISKHYNSDIPHFVDRKRDIEQFISLSLKVIYLTISKHYNSSISYFVSRKKDIEQLYHFPQKLYTRLYQSTISTLSLV